MIKAQIETKLFKLFVEHGVNNNLLYNDLIELISNENKIAIGHCDSETYDAMVKLINNENNAGWDSISRHSKRINIINNQIDIISERSPNLLP